MSTTNETKKVKYNCQRGIIFSTDAIVSFTIILFTLMIFTVSISNTTYAKERMLMQNELDEKAIFLADSLVKNQNTENAVLGACNYDSSKRRVLANSLNFEQMKTNSKQISLEDFFVKSITITFIQTAQKETISLSTTDSTDCTSVKRFALVDSKKAQIEVKTCRKE